MSDTAPALIWCPFPERESAKVAATTLLDEKLIACANLLGEMMSLFEWGGERDTGTEIGVLFKTNCTVLDRAVLRLAELHPYEEPAIVGWRCDAAAPGTASWLAALG